MKKLLLLGASGSIGTNTVAVLRALKEEYQLVGLSVHTNTACAAALAAEFHVPYVAVTGCTPRESDFPTGTRVLTGREGLLWMCENSGADVAVGAIVGIAGLEATVACIRAGMDIALANKETLVTGGALVKDLCREKGVALYPVDSEHSAIFQCLQGLGQGEVLRLILTCSGGPFFGRTAAELEHVSAQDALRHPTWKMGSKITIDSATLMNKGLEVIEAHWLFDMPAEAIDVLIHRQSVVHSLVETRDHALLAQLGTADMRLPIQYALTYPRRTAGTATRLDLAAAGALTFAHPDVQAFPCLALGYEALRRGGAAAVALNAANEAAVEKFLKNEIKFSQIPVIIEAAMDKVMDAKAADLQEILEIDRRIRREV